MYRRGEVGQIARALRILDALRGYRQGRSLSELATEVDVSERTVRRDLADLIDVLGPRLQDADAASDLEGRAVTVFAAERFIDADHLRRTSFTPPTTFKLADVMHGAFGIHVGDPGDSQDVVIEFSKERANYARSRLWHPTQHLNELPNGRLRLRFRCTNLLPVISWILEWGPHARVTAPPTLIEHVIRELEAARAQY